MTKSSSFFRTAGRAFLSHLTIQMKTIAALAAFYLVFFGIQYVSGGSTFTLSTIIGILPFFAVLCELSAGTYYNRLYQTFCCTRRANWCGNQLAKVITSLTFFLLMMLCAAANVWINGENVSLSGVFSAYGGWFLALEIFALLSFGELFGVFCQRFGKIGMLIYIIFCAGLGGVIGFLGAMSADTIGGSDAATAIMIPVSPFTILISIAAAALFSGASYLLSFRKDIK